MIHKIPIIIFIISFYSSWRLCVDQGWEASLWRFPLFPMQLLHSVDSAHPIFAALASSCSYTRLSKSWVPLGPVCIFSCAAVLKYRLEATGFILFASLLDVQTYTVVCSLIYFVQFSSYLRQKGKYRLYYFILICFLLF